MRAQDTDKTKRVAPAPRWGWSGVSEKLPPALSEADVEGIVTLLPSRKSSTENLRQELLEIGAAFGRYLHQVEFGPTRAQQTQALRILCRGLDALSSELEGLSPPLRELRADYLSHFGSPAGLSESDLFASYAADKDAIQAAALAATDMCGDMKDGRAGEARAMSKLSSTANRIASLLMNLDTTSDGDVMIDANLDDSAGPSDCRDSLAVLHFQIGRLRLGRPLEATKRPNGPKEAESLNGLVWRLCNIWTRETGLPVTASPSVGAGQPQSEAGRFVRNAVEALLPTRQWFEDRKDFADSVRAAIFLRESGHRLHRIHMAMQDYVWANSDNVQKSRRGRRRLPLERSSIGLDS